MDIACKDLIEKKISDEINKREKIIRQSYENIQTSTLEKNLVEPVLKDYKEFYSYLRNEKQKQYDALSIIKKHLEKLEKDTSILNMNGKQLKKDQDDILKKLSVFNNQLKEIPK